MGGLFTKLFLLGCCRSMILLLLKDKPLMLSTSIISCPRVLISTTALLDTGLVNTGALALNVLAILDMF